MVASTRALASGGRSSILTEVPAIKYPVQLHVRLRLLPWDTERGCIGDTKERKPMGHRV